MHVRKWMPDTAFALAVLIATAQAPAASPLPDYATLVEPVDALDREEAALLERLATAPDDQAARRALVRTYVARGDHEKGLPEAEKLLAAVPDDEEVLGFQFNLLGRLIAESSLFAKKRAAERMLATCQGALDRNPKNVTAIECLTTYLYNAPSMAGGDRDRALQLGRSLEALDAAAYNGFQASLARAAEDLEAADAHYTAALATETEVADILPIVYFRVAEKRWDGAFAALDRARTLDPESQVVRYQIGRTAALSGQRLEEGRDALLVFLSGPSWWQGNDFRAGAHWRLGMIYEQLGELELAKLAYTRSLDHDPDQKDAKAALKRLR